MVTIEVAAGRNILGGNVARVTPAQRLRLFETAEWIPPAVFTASKETPDSRDIYVPFLEPTHHV